MAVATPPALYRLSREEYDPMVDSGALEGPLAASEMSEPEPEPDVALAEHDDPARRPSTALLVVEIAITSRRQDEHEAAVYAGAAVPEYWLVDVEDRSVTVYSGPGGTGYARRVRLAGEDALRPPIAVAPLTVAGLFAAARL